MTGWEGLTDVGGQQIDPAAAVLSRGGLESCAGSVFPPQMLAELRREGRSLPCVSVRDAERLVAGTSQESRRATAPSGSTKPPSGPPRGEPDESPVKQQA